MDVPTRIVFVTKLMITITYYNFNEESLRFYLKVHCIYFVRARYLFLGKHAMYCVQRSTSIVLTLLYKNIFSCYPNDDGIYYCGPVLATLTASLAAAIKPQACSKCWRAGPDVKWAIWGMLVIAVKRFADRQKVTRRQFLQQIQVIINDGTELTRSVIDITI